ncbi:hypothetical protein [Pseudoxanthomonas mexicana]|uniref:hypothetical protein n=1 Tax=Pseudoxanthomonas mexicana TaxID=128785 RepID=UPI00398B9D83
MSNNGFCLPESDCACEGLLCEVLDAAGMDTSLPAHGDAAPEPRDDEGAWP